MKNLWNREPAALIGLLLTVAVAVADHFAHLTDGQWQHLLDAAPLLSGLATRFRVSPAAGDRVAMVLDALASAERDADVASKRLAELHAAVAPTVAVIAPAAPAAPAAVVAPTAPAVPADPADPVLVASPST